MIIKYRSPVVVRKSMVLSMIKKAEGNYDPAKVEREIAEYWSNSDIYGKLKSMRSEGQKIYFLDGPPYTTGDIHAGTALNKSLKDLRIRFWRMNGYNVRDQPGWDMHGLPIEVNVEKSFGIKTKKDIEKIGIDRFVSECRKFALKNLNNMTQQFRRLGVWMDWDKPYMTIERSFTETAWLTLKKAMDAGLLFLGERSTQWCYRCGTALAEAEIEYVEKEDPSIYVRFPLKDSDYSLLIWTTTPWTLVANMAVAVHPDMDYAEVEYRKKGQITEKLIVLEQKAEEIGSLSDQEEYEIVRVMKGSDLVGKAYTFPLEGFAKKGKEGEWSWKVIPSDSVELEYTGLVHTAPGHGPEDFNLGKKFNLDIYCPVLDDGTYSDDAGKDISRKRVSQCNDLIIGELKRTGLLYYSGRIKHRYGNCWRCKTPIIYRSTMQWYIRATELRERMLEEINRIKWVPDWAGSSRQAEWARNLKDWCISRQRFWGTPIPVWRCAKCSSERLISSVSELSGGRNYVEGMDLHRPSIDAVVFKCEKCGGEMKRVPDVLDVWFDSGICSWASLNYNADRKEFDIWWPGKWITEAGDQTRGWFNSQIATSLIMFNRAPFESALLHGWVNDSRGRQMHKSLGNVVDPMEVIESDGADALRFYILGSRAPWDDISFQQDGPKNARKTLNILWNVYNFASTYMSLDNFKSSPVDWKALAGSLKIEDRWILSKTQSVIGDATGLIDALEVHKALRSIDDFIVEDLSRWYVRMVRDRTWTEEESREKAETYTVLHYVLTAVSKLLAPFTPFISEEIFRAMNPEALSVHLSTWPEVIDVLRDAKLEADMVLARQIVEAVLKSRQETGMKLRWPLSRIVIKPVDDSNRKSIGRMLDIIEKQSNAKSSKLLQPAQEWEELVLTVVPDPNAIGKVYRQWSGKIAMMLKIRPAAEVINGIKGGSYSLGIEGQTIKIEENMVSFSYTLPRNVAQIDLPFATVYVDFNMDRKLELESLSREVMRRIQKMRKEMGLNVDEYVHAQIATSGSLLEAIVEWNSVISSECRIGSLEIVANAAGELKEAWKIDRNDLVIALSRTKAAAQPEAAQPAQEKSAAGTAPEQQAPAATEEDETFVIESGETYAIFEDKPDKGMAIFRSAMESGLNGFLITREFPEKLEKKYGVSNCRIIWLTAVGGKNAVKPSDLETISLQVNDFFSKDSGIAFIDGTEYLISNNTFASVVRLIQYLKDTAAKSKSILLLSVNPESMNEKDLKVLQKEVDKII